MKKQEIRKVTETIYRKIIDYYGESKFYKSAPYVSIEDSPYSDEEVPQDLYGEYCFIMNEVTLYWKNITSIEILTRTLVHEYQHYLQSPSWRTRYYNMGYGYDDHPYEVQAFKEEENWTKFI